MVTTLFESASRRFLESVYKNISRARPGIVWRSRKDENESSNLPRKQRLPLPVLVKHHFVIFDYVR